MAIAITVISIFLWLLFGYFAARMMLISNGGIDDGGDIAFSFFLICTGPIGLLPAAAMFEERGYFSGNKETVYRREAFFIPKPKHVREGGYKEPTLIPNAAKFFVVKPNNK